MYTQDILFWIHLCIPSTYQSLPSFSICSANLITIKTIFFNPESGTSSLSLPFYSPHQLHIQPGPKNNPPPCFTSFLGSSCLSILSAGYMCHSDSLHFSVLFLPLSPVFYSRHHHFLPTLWSLWSNYLPLAPPWFRVCSTVALSLKHKHYQYPLAIG